MKIIFFGTDEFAVPGLERLLDSEYEVALVVTQPDRPKGRRLKISASPVKECALKKKTKVIQPEVLSEEFADALRKLEPELFVVIAYGHILKKELLEVPKAFAINVHASLLPKYRGAAPVNWAIINGEKETGITVIKMSELMDEGDIILKKKIGIDPLDTAASLDRKLSALGADALMEALGLIKEKKQKLVKQDRTKASPAPKLKKEDGLLDWSLSAVEIHNRVKGLNPWPGAYTHWEGKLLKIWRTGILTREAGEKPGTIAGISKDGIKVAAGKGMLEIKELQLEGKRRMGAKEFLSGHGMNPGEPFG